MNAIDVLENDHREMEQLLGRLANATGDERASLFGEMSDRLTAHITVEEQHFYPAVKAGRTEDILLESLEEHLSLKRVLADLLGLAPSDARFEPKLHVLKEQVEHHHKEEEEHLFPKVRKLFDAETLESMGDEIERRIRQTLGRNIRGVVLNQTKEAAPLL